MNKKIYLAQKDQVDFRLSSDTSDDTFDFEVWHKNECILVFHIHENGSITVYFGKIEMYTIDYNLLESISKTAEARLTTELKNWLDSKIEF